MSYKKKTTDGVRGRPTKLTQQNIELALMLRDKGFTIKEIAEALGIDESVLYFKGTEWEVLRKKLNAIKAKKEAEKINKVSHALYDRAIGQTVKTVKEVYTKDGIIQLTEKKEIPGDVRAQEFYLINRDPENWKATQDEKATETTGKDTTIKIKFED